MTQTEIDIWNNFCDDVKSNSKKMGLNNTDTIEYTLKLSIYYQYSRGYHSDIGFYEIEFGDRGRLFETIRTQDISDCMWHYLKKIASIVASSIEMNNRNENQKSWKYKTQYDGRLHKFCDAIKFLIKIYDETEYLESYIKYCTGLMNFSFEDEHWKYDKELREFFENTNSKKISFYIEKS